MQIPTIDRDEYSTYVNDWVHRQFGTSDLVMGFEIDVYSRVGKFLESIVGTEYTGSGSPVPGGEQDDGVWFEGTYDDLRIRIFLPWSKPSDV